MNRPFAGRPIIMELAARKPFRVGNATIDPIAREAHWRGGEERLQPQTLKVLFALAARRGELVTRDELVEICWDGRVIGDDVINRAISLLRPFAERAGGFSIETVTKAGYRLIENGHGNPAKRRWPIAIAGAGSLLVAAVAGGIALTKRAAAPQSPILRVAVEPITYDLGDESSRRLAGQVEQSSIRMLTESGVSVSNADEDRISNSRADFILSGSVSGSGKQSVATVQLDDPLRHAIVLSRQIPADTADPAALPDQVGAQLSAALSWIAPLIRLDQAHPSDPTLIANLLNTNQSSFDSQRSFELARRTAPSAPDSAIAQLALATSTGMNLAETPPAERPEVLAAGQEAAARVVRLVPNFGNSYTLWCLLHEEVRLADCEVRLRDGLLKDPQASTTGTILSHLLQNVGRTEEAVPIAAEALAKEPYGPGKIAHLLILLDATGQSDEARNLFKRGRRLWPHFDGLFESRMSGVLARGNWGAVAELEKEVGVNGLPPKYESLAPLARAVTSQSLQRARALCPGQSDGARAITCMLALAQLGDLDNSFKLADRLYPRRTARTAAEEETIWLYGPGDLDTLFLTGPGAAPMRRDARFTSLADRVGLVRYWRSNGLPDFCTRDHEPVCRQISNW